MLNKKRLDDLEILDIGKCINVITYLNIQIYVYIKTNRLC